MFHGALVPFVERRIIKMKKTKIIITAAIMAALVTATACGGKNQASTATEAQTTTVAVKQVNSTSTENATDKQEVTEASVENTEVSNEEVLVAEAVIDENQENSDSVEEVNNTVPEEQPAEDINATWTDTTPAEQPVEEAPVEDTNSGAVEEAPVEDTNGVVEETPVEQPIAPEPAPEPTPEPVVTPQEPAAPTLTDEERLVATGKWTKDNEGSYITSEGESRTYYTYIDPITGYELTVLFKNGNLATTMTKTREEYMAITAAHNNVMLSTIEGLEQL